MTDTNVLLIVLDAVRADHLSCYGYEHETTPAIDRLAANGVRFEHAFSTSNWTGAAHGSLFTGYLPSKSGIYGDSQKLPEDIPTLAELLSEAGYRTFATSAGAHIRSDRGYDRGFDKFHETFRIRPNHHYLRQFIKNSALRKQTWQTLVHGHDNYTTFKFENLKEWIKSSEDPFFAFINCKTAHHRYNPPRPYKSMFGPDVNRPRWEFAELLQRRLGKEPQSVDGFDMDRLTAMSRQYPVIADEFNPSDNEWEIIKTWYDGAIRYMDDQLADLLSFLRSAGKMDDTLVIVTADHGDLFGEHDLEKHQYSLLDKLLHIPLVMSPPSDRRETISNMVSFVDLFPTILDITNAEVPDRPNATTLTPLTDRVFHDYLFAEVGRKSPEPVQRAYPSFTESEYNGPVQSIRDKRYKLVRSPNSIRRLCDWRQDPKETSDLSDELSTVRERLEQELEESVKSMDDSILNDDIDDDRLKQHLKDLGYR
ncbi:sulfatase [Halomicrobium urmianum]|uniref:sulfatase n=1 Tax=Halomicrobium urmianum TaxID=1586233 RepID=UPI001CD9E133|nr:sulfatase [Halomicrobium urmianum]